MRGLHSWSFVVVQSRCAGALRLVVVDGSASICVTVVRVRQPYQVGLGAEGVHQSKGYDLVRFVGVCVAVLLYEGLVIDELVWRLWVECGKVARVVPLRARSLLIKS
jgi:hypothetical protein